MGADTSSQQVELTEETGLVAYGKIEMKRCIQGSKENSCPRKGEREKGAKNNSMRKCRNWIFTRF